jgi:2-keto-4-pentenoate hydratase/2-oxohepta-3-ene-1,7-dioic acid hydratase in catechol pathway
VRSEPHITVRIAGSIIGPEDPIIRPKDAESLREEVELVAVIGKKCKRVPREKIAEYILGYTVGNDLTIKGFEYDDEGWKAKGCDTMHPIGPWVETDIDPDKIMLRARVDGVEVQAEPMSTHLFDVASIIATINKYVTLYPGDMVFLGTSGDPVDCVPGDVVEVEAEGIGVLRNPVVAEN